MRASLPVVGRLAALLALVAGVGITALSSGTSPPGTQRDGDRQARVQAGSLLPLDGRSPGVAEGERVRVIVELRRPSLGQRMAQAPLALAEQGRYVRSLGREVRAQRRALEARGVGLSRTVDFARVASGFAATVDREDLPELQDLGASAQPVRRFYPAVSERRVLAQAERPDSGRRSPRRRAGRLGKPRLALLDSGVDARHPDLRARVVEGIDAAGKSGAPRMRGALGEHGTELAGVLAQALAPRERLLSIRVAARRRDAGTGVTREFATTDSLLAGLESAVDPNADGQPDDAIPVALVGLNSPYAGFPRSPEARAARAASELGTLVVAPAGNEGDARGVFGTVGSPAAAPAVLAVGALEPVRGPGLPEITLGLRGPDGRAALAGRLLGGRAAARSAPVASLTGPSQADSRQRGRAGGTELLEYFSVDGRPRARGRVVVVPAEGAATGALPQAAAAAREAGAVALVVCAAGGALPALPRGASNGMPVIGLSGAAAREALELSGQTGSTALVSPARATERVTAGGPSASSSAGPTFGLRPKPDVAAGGVAQGSRAGGRRTLVAGTSVAAARVAAVAVGVQRARPELAPAELAAALMGTARPAGPLMRSGAGVVDAGSAARAALLAGAPALTLRPRSLRGRRTAAGSVLITNRGRRSLRVKVGARSTRAMSLRVTPRVLSFRPGQSRRVRVRARLRRPGPSAARIAVTPIGRRVPALGIPLSVRTANPPPPQLGALELVREGRGVRGVSFTAGVVRRRGDSTAVEPVGNLRLELDREGGSSRELTPPAGGATDLLPGEYAYALTRAIRSELTAGRYRFIARARGPAGGRPVVRRSSSFHLP